LNLGVFKTFCWATLWAILDHDALKIGSGVTMDVRRKLTVERLRGLLFAWYSRREKTHPLSKIQKLSDLTLPMLGNPDSVSLSTKAAETGTLVHFCVDLLREYRSGMGARAPALLKVGESLEAIQEILHTSPRVMSASAMQSFVDHCKKVMTLAESAGMPKTPKFHLMLHLVCNAQKRGNPHFPPHLCG